jgi:hypothetical protein
LFGKDSPAPYGQVSCFFGDAIKAGGLEEEMKVIDPMALRMSTH